MKAIQAAIETRQNLRHDRRKYRAVTEVKAIQAAIETFAVAEVAEAEKTMSQR